MRPCMRAMLRIMRASSITAAGVRSASRADEVAGVDADGMGGTFGDGRMSPFYQPQQLFVEVTRGVPSSDTVRSRSALAITLTDDSAMAAAAMTGDSSMPKTG